MPVIGDDGPPYIEASVRRQIEGNTWWAYQPDPVCGPCIVAIIEVVTNSVYTKSDVESWEPPGSAALHLEPTHPKQVYATTGEPDFITEPLQNLFDRITNDEFAQFVREGKLAPLAPRPLA